MSDSNDSSELLLRALARSADGVVLTNPSGRVLHANRSWVTLVGAANAEEVLGRPLRLPVRGEVHPESLLSDNGGKPELVTELGAHGDKPGLGLSLLTSPVIGDGGAIDGYLVVARDIVHIAQTQALLAARYEQAERSSRAKTASLAHVVHELRTPLNSVIGFANLLLGPRGVGLKPAQRKYVERIAENGAHLLQIINQILDLSKVEGGRTELGFDFIDLGQLVESTLAQLEGQVADRAIELRADVQLAPAMIETDPVKLKQILLNLVGNAIKFTERGTITVRVCASRAGRPLCLDVVDNGPGIPQAQLATVFEAFRQAGDPSSRSSGTGLGLAIARAFCRLLRYGLEVESSTGQGTTFRIVFGAAEASELPRSERPRVVIEKPLDYSTKRILIIEDDEGTQVYLRAIMGTFGAEVRVAGTGAEGLREARAFAPDLISLDLVLPDVSGLDVLRELRGDPRTQTIPVITVSVLANGDRTLNLGITDVLHKPFRHDDFRRAVRRGLGGDRHDVLIVENGDEERLLMAALLRGEQCSLRFTCNGEEALAALEAKPADLLILELELPIVDGFTLLKRVRADSRHADMRIIVATRKNLTHDDLVNIGELSVAVLEKSSDLDRDLRRIVRTVLR